MNNSGDMLWSSTLTAIQPQLPKIAFETWLAATEVESYDGNEMVIRVHTREAFDFINVNSHLVDLIHATLANFANRTVRTSFKILQRRAEHAGAAANGAAGKPADASSASDAFNPRYTFDTFVMGEKNKFAYAASLAVSERPAEKYNPFFLYGGVGLGKTHLLHAIAQRTLELHPGARVVYVTSETFVREFISALQSHTVDDFRNKYRHVDFLLIDDIQFISGKESTLEEFFHTFNSLYNERRQIALTSDRPPHEIADLGDRLRSRFAGGLLVDIQPPELETRVAILRKKAKAEAIEIPDDVVFLIASRIETNVRELEGALIRVFAFSSMTNRDVDTAMAEHAIADLVVNPARRQLTPVEIQRAICTHYQVRIEDLKGRSRQKDIARYRHIAMYLVRELTSLSLPKIGQEFGGRDHTTVLHACGRIEREMGADPRLSVLINRLKDTLKASQQWG